MTKFYLYYSCIGFLVCLSASLVFYFHYGNIQGGIWAAVAALMAGLCFFLHRLYFSNKLHYYFSSKSLNRINIFSFIVVLLGSTFSIWYLFTIVYWKILIRALAAKRKLKSYSLEKEIAKTGNANVIINESVSKSSEYICKLFYSPNISLKENGFLHKFLIEDSIENYILKSVFGFIGGVLLTYICFMFLIFSLNFSLKRATYICIGLGIVLTLGLAFSVKIRCTVFLCIPQLFSKRGRQALLAYAFILALSGPAKNTLHNVEVMSESLACGQEQIKQAENELLKCVKMPNAAAKKAIEKLLEKITSAVKDFKNFILLFYKNSLDILETVLLGQKWLCSISLLCCDTFGSPFKRCSNLLDETSENCKSVSDSRDWKSLCNVNTQMKGKICPLSNEDICLKRDVSLKLPVPTLKNKLDTFRHRAMNIIYVTVEAHQTYSQCNHSSTCHEEYQGVATEIRQKTDQFLQYFDVMSVIFGIFILVLFAKVIIYRHKFLTQDHFDNRFITSDFVDIDNTRAEFRMATILPLEPREKIKYIKVTSIRLAPCERVQLLSSFVFLLFATFKIIIHLLTDSALFWILSTIRRDERLLYMSNLDEVKPDITIKVIGHGLVSSLIRNVTKAIKRQSATTRSDPTPCLPDPIPPDWNRYYQILALIIICWLLALCEPYGLRLRHSVMVTYHPDRARERAIWLYNSIVSNRINFLKTARRQIRRKYKYVSKDTLDSFQFIRKSTTTKCLLCKVKVSSKEDHVKCPSSNCVGVFCVDCFASLKVCSICYDPAEYGDLSDFSAEKDSSEDENSCRCSKKKTSSQKPASVSRKVGALNLAVKMPKLNLKKEVKKHTKDGSLVLQPKFFLGTTGYCKDKFPKLRKKISISDLESSDWEYDVSACTDDNLFGDIKEVFDENEIVNRKTNQKVKTKIWKKHDISLKSIRSKATVCLFRKISEENILSSLVLKDEMRKVNRPNFLFKNIKKGLEDDSWYSQKFLKTRNKEQNIETVDVPGGGGYKLMIHQEGSTNDKQTQTLRHDLQSSIRSENSITINETAQLPTLQPLLSVHKYKKQRETHVGELPSLTPSCARICLKSNDSSDCNRFKICVREDTVTSSLESDCQFYNQPYTSSEYNSDLGTKLNRVRRSPAKLNLTPKRQNKVKPYLVETDSSNEVFLSAKPDRRKKKKHKKTEGSEALQEFLMSCSRKSRKSEFLKAKLARLYRIGLSKRKSSSEGLSSNDTEYELNSTVFLSEEEFQELSQKLERRKHLSWAPDLLTDLPKAERRNSKASNDRV